MSGHHHDHDASHDHHEAAWPQLEPGYGRGKTLFIDAFSGVSGDMTISALLDLGVPLRVVDDAVHLLPVQGYHLSAFRRWRSGICAGGFDVHVDASQPERTWLSIDEMLATSPLAEPTRQLARRIFRRLGEAEAHVHQSSIEEVHFHEVGAVDAIVDIVGVAAMLTWLEPSNIACSPLPIGRGFVRARHGVLPLPAPAALECLRGIPTYGVDLEAELVTPTGAAIVASIASSFVRWPSMTVDRAGFGSGTKEHESQPNLLRVVLGTADQQSGSHIQIDTNVDDMTGELTAHVIDTLMTRGALDVWATPTTTKKGRPGLVISVLGDAAHASVLEHALLSETTSIGVRSHTVARVERPRTVVQVSTRYGLIPLKVSAGGYGPDQVKPEFGVCAMLAKEAGVPVREVIAEAIAEYRRPGG